MTGNTTADRLFELYTQLMVQPIRSGHEEQILETLTAVLDIGPPGGEVKLTKTHHICRALDANGPMTRDELLRAAWALEGSKGRYNPESNSCYFSPTGRGRGGSASLIKRGLITAVGKRGQRIVYDLTPAGKELALSIE